MYSIRFPFRDFSAVCSSSVFLQAVDHFACFLSPIVVGFTSHYGVFFIIIIIIIQLLAFPRDPSDVFASLENFVLRISFQKGSEY